MKFLIKLFCLLSLVSSFAFSKEVWVKTDDVLDGLKPMNNCEFFLGKNFFKCSFQETGTYRVFRVNSFKDYLYFNPTKSSGYYYNTMYNYFVDKVQYSGYFNYVSKYSSYLYSESDAQSGELFTYTNITEFRLNESSYIECSAGDNYGIKSNKCFPACPAGQSWDYENEVCYSDCSDKDLNKFGYSNGTAQGGCIDCSNAFTNDDISSCLCAGYGTSMGEKIVFLNPDGPFVSTYCADGRFITFKKRSKENPDKDKENPDKDKEKDKNENGNNDNTGEQDNNSPDNNSGGTSGNGSSGGGGSSLGSETKPNPNYKGEEGKEDGKGEEGKQEGKEDGKGKEGKGEYNVVAGKLDYGDLKKDADKFKSDFKGALDDVISKTQDFKNSLDGLISKIKDGGLMKFNQSAIPSTCPLEYKVNLIYFEKDLIFDICKAISPASKTFYYFFYLAFFVLFLIVTIKLFILTFMGV